MPGHVFLAHGQDVVRVVVVVLPRADMQEIVDPVTRFRPVGVVHDADGEAFFALGIEHEAPFVQFVDVDSLAGGDMQLPVLLPDLEERIAGLGLEKPDSIDRLAPETAAGEIDDVKFAALDLRVCARLVKVPGKAHGVVVERLPVVEHLTDEIIDFVAGQVGFVVEVVVLLGFETSGEIGGQGLHQAGVADLTGQCGGDEQGLVLGLVPDDMHGQRRDPGIFRI